MNGQRVTMWMVVAVVAAVALVGCTSTVRPTVAVQELVFDLRADDFVMAGDGVVGLSFRVPAITPEALSRGMTVDVWWQPDFSDSWWALPYSFQGMNDTHAIAVHYTIGDGRVGFRLESGDTVAVEIWRGLAVGKLRVVLTGHPDDLRTPGR